MATRTPERRPSLEGALQFNNQRRYSRVYDQPIVQKTLKGYSVHVEDDTHSELSHAASDGQGKILNPEASWFGSLICKIALVSLIVLGLVISAAGNSLLLIVFQLVGFVLVLMAVFLTCSGLYLWWASWSHCSVNFSVRRVLVLFGVCSASNVIAWVLTTLASRSEIPLAGSLPLEASYIILLGTLLFVNVSFFAHHSGLNAMFSNETCAFVGLTLVLDFSSRCVFGHILPQVILPHIVYISALFGLTLSLMGHRFPHLSLTNIYWVMRHLSHPMLVRKLSNASTASLCTKRLSASSFSSSASAQRNATHFGGIDMDVVTEAHGLIGDLLLNEACSDNTRDQLRRVRELLAPKVNKQIQYGPRTIIAGKQTGQDDKDYESDASSIKTQTLPSSMFSRQLRKSSTPRRSSTKFSTTTTSSGMPVVDTEPLDRHRSIALREVRARISLQETGHSVHKLTQDHLSSSHIDHRVAGESPLTLSRSGLTPYLSESEMSTGGFGSPESVSSWKESSNRSASPSTDTTVGMTTTSTENVSAGLSDRQPIAIKPRATSLHDDPTPLQRIDESEEMLVGSLTRPRSQTMPKHMKLSPSSDQLVRSVGGKDLGGWESTSLVGTPVIKVEVEEVDGQDMKEVKEVKEVKEGNVIRLSRGTRKSYSLFTKYKDPNISYSLEEYSASCLDVFEKVALWDFPIFELEDKAGDHILSHMAFIVFQEAGLMETFQIPQREFVNYFRALESNYGLNVYHNKTHAADVLHATSYLLFEMIPEFSHEFSYEHSDQRVWKGYQRTKTSGGNIASAFSILEVFATYMAAAMHDFDHPGRTNAFLVATKSPLAILYNDRSVLENHHVASSWDLLTSDPTTNFLGHLQPAEMKRFRFLVIEAILATDLKHHFDILSEFKAKVNPDEGGGIDWNSEVDRLLVMKMIIKMADISTPAKSYDLHRSWTKRITEEFYQQSDEETRLGLQGTIFMDRSNPGKLPAIQLSFIQNLVSPLFHACAEGGIIPGILELVKIVSRSPTPLVKRKMHSPNTGAKTDTEEGEEDTLRIPAGSLECDLNLEIGDDAFMIDKEEEERTQKFMSIILTNLQVNYEGWQAELPTETGKVEDDANGNSNADESTDSQQFTDLKIKLDDEKNS